MIKANENQYAVFMMCRLLSVSRSGYYAWKCRPPSPREQSNRLLKIEIKRVFDDEKGRPGAPRIARRLQDEGKAAGRHRVARIMQDNGWRAKAARKYKATTNSKHSLPVAPNLLEQNFMADRPDQKWVSDITTIWTDEGWLYLAVVLELYSRRVVGWAIGERMTATLVCDALTMALYPRAQVEPEEANGRGGPLRPGQPILFSRLPEAVQKTPADLQHEQEGRLL